jgi:hypothetical protein
MKRVCLVLFAATLVPASVASEIVELQFEPGQFDEDTYSILVDESMTRTEPKALQSQSYDVCLKEEAGRFEIRYVFFTQKGPIEDPVVQVSMWAAMVISNAAGYRSTKQNTKAFRYADVREEFNADYGITSFGHGGVTDFTDGYTHVMMNVFYKKNLGIVCQAMMFNDTALIQTEEFVKQFHSFKFN